jgi:murein DD-endopeptidase MepM/ murein hydrolase activator NlpD
MPIPAPHLLGLLLTTAALPSLSLGPAQVAADAVLARTPGSLHQTAPAPSPPPSGALGTSPRLTPGSSTSVWPLSPRPAVVAGFDPPASAYGSGHRGVDLAGAPRQPVRAAAAGRVTYAGSLAGRGVVVVSHGPTRTTYEPVRATVRVGDRVDAGTVLGRLQASGSHCSPVACLHWGLIEGSTYLDPLTLVDAGPVRLLPLLPAQRAGL